ncbi:SDR family NAD(P)-dependent oxidoreductase [Dermatobacter hominis]|uniref:SDR family NAD(P)-dependent oxidoreductase n=1 Tax=Dermatobacter hominis TaxID=2884263 RepID=UPI001D11C249|nr:SDR family NAD(P)-dependent oxidoreductase [Dermatobacter hominis]UDY34965.1 SDR family NAD(P)-dependent oxidoreductase [Dermatobacter hominis]
MPLAGSVVVVTGASSGLGRATALGLADEGAALVLVARGRPALEHVAARCRERGATAASIVVADIADSAAVERVRHHAVEQHGEIDVWVQAAASVVAGPLGQESAEERDAIVRTDVAGTLHCAAVALQQFRAQRHGTLVLVSSLLGMVPNPVVPAYVMAKFSVRGLGLSLRRAVADERDLHVCVVLPGPMDTPLFQRAANHTGFRLRAIPPAGAPERTARTILSCIRRPRRQATSGVLAHCVLVTHRISPRATEWAVARWAGRLITTREREEATTGTLLRPSTLAGSVSGGWRRGGLRRRWGDALGVGHEGRARRSRPASEVHTIVLPVGRERAVRQP